MMRQGIARLVRAGLCRAVVKLFEDADAVTHEHMLELRFMAVLRAAILVVPNGGVPTWFLNEQATRPPRTPGQKRLVISIAQAGNEVALLDRAVQQDERYDWLLLHEATARLELAASERPPGVSTPKEEWLIQHLDPLAPLSARIQPVRRLQELTASDTFFGQALGFLLPSFEAFRPANSENGRRAARAVARMLSSVAPQNLQPLLQQRLPLTRAILNGGNAQWRGKAIATPPGVGVPGLVGVEGDVGSGGQRVVRVNFKDGDTVPFCPPDLDWKRCDELEGETFRPQTASLGTRHLLDPFTEGDLLPPTVLSWLAEAFISLAGSQIREGEKVCAATAVNLVGRGIGEARNEAVWHVLGYEVNAARLRGQAFIRRGHGLMLEPVADWQDHLWRTGTALADFLGRLDVSRSMPSLRLAAKANIMGTWLGLDSRSDASL